MKAVKSILVVGGGSSGWMTAAYLSNVLSEVQVTLVESPGVPVIGVGEATFPFIKTFLGRIGLGDDHVWMPRCDATFKTGILYRNWFEIGDEYWHPLFEDLDYLDGPIHSGHAWVHLNRRKHPDFPDRRSFYESCFLTTPLNANNNRIPVSSEYAYHIDVGRYLELLKGAARRVRHVVDHVGEVRLNVEGEIEALHTAQSGELKADLYVDCTGFRRHLIRRVDPQGPFIPYSDSLFNDSAVVLRFPYLADRIQDEMRPFVTASAQSAGWIWTIPLYSQISSGYVYSSAFLSPDQAELELRRYWGEERTRDVQAFKLNFTTGKLERLWVKNCVAVGLSGGFVEPLESSGLAITQLGVEMLASMLDARYYEPGMIQRYNAYLEKFYTDIVHFLIVHYCLTSREDTPFWRAVRQETHIPPELHMRLKVFQEQFPTFNTKGTSEVWMFRDLSWFSVLLGMNFNFDTPPLEDHILAAFQRLLEDKRQAAQDMLRNLPNHYRYLLEQVYNGKGA